MTLFRTALLLASLALAGGARADTVTLRRSVRLAETGGAVTLEMIADLEGPAAQRLAGTVIAPDAADLPGVPGSAARTVPVARVRAALDEAAGVNWAFLTLRGSETRLLPPAVRPAEATEPDRPLAPPPETEALPMPEGSIGVLARSVLEKILGVRAADLRLAWDLRDDAFLRQQIDGRTVNVQPVGRGARMPLTVTIYEGERIAETRTVRADVAVRRVASVVSTPIGRGDAIDPEQVVRSTLWLDPGTEPADLVDGQIATRRLEPGAVIAAADTSPPFVVRRGDVISLHCVAGAIVLQSPARALADGRDGEQIEVEMLSTRQRVTARVSGEGRAVMVVNAPNAAAGDHAKEGTP